MLDTGSIAKRMGLSKSTTYKYVQTLETCGFLVREDGGTFFKLGPRLVTLVSGFQPASTLVEASYLVMRNLVEQTNETALLATIMGNRAVCLSRVEGNHNLKLTYEIGTTYPLHAGASALVLLAGVDAKVRHKLLPTLTLDGYTQNTITSFEGLRSRLDQICKDGYAVSEGELDEGAFAVAAPVTSSSGKVVASLSLGGPIYRFDEDKEQRYVQLVCAGARRISELMDVHTYPK